MAMGLQPVARRRQAKEQPQIASAGEQGTEHLGGGSRRELILQPQQEMSNATWTASTHYVGDSELTCPIIPCRAMIGHSDNMSTGP
jgi:hypothetical protein